MDILSSPLLTTSIALESIGSPLHPCATSLLPPLSILVSLFLYFFLYLIPIFIRIPSPFNITTNTSVIANCQCQPRSLQRPSFSAFSFLFLSLFDQVQRCWSTFRYIFLLIFICFIFLFLFFCSFSTYLFHPNYLLFYSYLFQNVGLFVYFSFLFSTLIYCMDE